MNLRNVGARYLGRAPTSQFAIDEEHEATAIFSLRGRAALDSREGLTMPKLCIPNALRRHHPDIALFSFPALALLPDPSPGARRHLQRFGIPAPWIRIVMRA